MLQVTPAMSRGLIQFPEDRRPIVAARRIMADTKGIGYWGAINYHDRKGLKYPAGSRAGQAQAIKEVQDNATIDEHGYHQAEPGEHHQGHKGGLRGRENGGGKSPGRSYKPTLSDIRKRKAARLEVPKMRNDFSKVGGGSRPPQRNA